MFTNALFAFTAFVLLAKVSSRPEGPPLPRACAPENQLVPRHGGTAPQTSAGPSPTSLDVEVSYVAGATLTGRYDLLLTYEFYNHVCFS